MPLREYQCSKRACRFKREIVVHGEPPKHRRCETCGGRMNLVKHSAPAPAQFKGGGFYRTDYGPKGGA
jgi:predicted nucleic acid-binding Zn ribbon protein